jgi:hypothetical protein
MNAVQNLKICLIYKVPQVSMGQRAFKEVRTTRIRMEAGKSLD